MNCRIVTAAVLTLMLAACGPESLEAGDIDLVGSQISGVTQVEASQDPIPARTPEASTRVSVERSSESVLVVVQGKLVLIPADQLPEGLLPEELEAGELPPQFGPVAPRAASQDPIPARTPPSSVGVTAVDSGPIAPQPSKL